MRVLLLSEFYPPNRGGLEVQVDTLAAELCRRGHDVHVVTMTPDPSPSEASVQTHVLPGGIVAHLPHIDATRPYHPPLPDPVIRRALGRLLSAVRPDVVHAHNWLAASLPHRIGAPLVFTAHDSGVDCPKRDRLWHNESVCSGSGVYRCLECLRHQGTSRPAAAALAVSMPAGRRLLRPDGLISITKSVRSTVAWHPPIDEIIPGCITDDFAAIMKPVPSLPDPGYVMFAGDPRAHKGSDLLVDIWSSPTPPDTSLLLSFTKAVALAVPERVRVVSLSHDEVPFAMSRAAVVVVPSRWPEGLGMVAVEAMATGVPVIAARIGGLPEVVEDGISGLLFEPGDGIDLRSKIDQVLADEGLRRALSAGALRRAERYKASTVIPEIIDVYERAIAAKSVGRRSPA